MFSKGQLHFTFSAKQPNALCKPAPLHPLPGPRPSSTGHGATDTTKARALSVPESERRRTQPGPLVKEYCSLSGSLLPPPEVSQRGFPCVCRRPSFIQCTLCHSPFQKQAIQTGRQTLGRFITRLGSSWPADSLLSPSPCFLAVGVACGACLSGTLPPPPGLPAGGGTRPKLGTTDRALRASSGVAATPRTLRSVPPRHQGARQGQILTAQRTGRIHFLGAAEVYEGLLPITLIPLPRAAGREEGPVPSRMPGTQWFFNRYYRVSEWVASTH